MQSPVQEQEGVKGMLMDTYDCKLSVEVAALSVLLLPKLFFSGTYIEGWIVVPRERPHIIEIIEHGWCKTFDQRIVDPTIVLMEDQDQRVFYFPRFELARAALGRSLSGSTLLLVCHSQYGKNGMQHEGYRLGLAAARKQAGELADEWSLPHSAIKVSARYRPAWDYAHRGPHRPVIDALISDPAAARAPRAAPLTSHTDGIEIDRAAPFTG